MTILCPLLGACFRGALFLLATSLLLSGAARAQNLNLLKNGGFELSTFNASAAGSGFGAIDGAAPSDPRRASVPNWTWSPNPSVPVGQVDPYSTAVHIYQSGGLPEGTKAANFGGGSAHPGGSISQSFAATPGSTYRVSFWVQRVGSGEPIGGVVTIRNDVNGSTVTTQPINMSAAASGHWSQRTFTFVAPSNSLTLTFSDATPLGSAGNTDLAVDNFSVETLSSHSLVILGANGTPGSIEANTDYSKDGGVTWHPAYLFTGHPWGYIPGTNAWLNQDPSPFVGLNEEVDFRIRFYVPPAWAAAHMTYRVNADNEADIFLNGEQVAHTIGGSISSGTLPAHYLVPGINTIYVRLIDYGGWVGLNYRIEISIDAAQPLERIAPPPSITSPLTAAGTVGTPFSYNIQATSSPTSRTASNLPPGLSVNSTTGVISGTPTVAGTYNVTLSASNNFGSSSRTLVLTIGQGAATVSLNNLVHTYDGVAKSASATTNPGGLPVNFSYTGASLPPLNAGSYGVFASINHANYSGFTNGTLLINKAPASVTLSNLLQPYNGSPRPIAVTTSPAGLATSVTYNGSAAAPSAIGTYAVSASVTNSNYTGTASGTLQITDSVKPVLTLPASPIVVEATGPNGASVSFSTSAVDNIDGPVLVTTSAASGSVFPLGNTVVTASAQDAAGNVANGSFTITVRDTTAPVISVAPPAEDLFAENFNGFFGGIRDTQQYLTMLWLSFNGQLPGWHVAGFHALHAIDLSGSGNYGAMIYNDNVITSMDAIAANEHGVDYLVKFASAPAVYATPGEATTADDGLIIRLLRADNSVAFEFVHQPGAYTGVSSLTPVVLNYTGDGSGALRVRISSLRPASGRFGGLIEDLVIARSGGSVTAPADLTLEATSSAGSIVDFTAVATDLVSGGVPVVATPASGSMFPLGQTTVTLQAADGAGNPATATFVVNVVDTTPPVIAMNAAPAVPVALINASFENPATHDHSETLIGWTRTGVAGIVNIASGIPGRYIGNAVPDGRQGAFINSGKIAQLLSTTLEAGKTYTLSGYVGRRIDDPITRGRLSLETVGGIVLASVKSAADQTLASWAYYETRYTATASDAQLGAQLRIVLENTTLQQVNFDAIALEVTDVPSETPADIAVEASSSAGAVVHFNALATDVVSGVLPVNSAPTSGSQFPMGTTPVQLTAIDAAGNLATASFNVIVSDSIAPVLNLPANQTLEATSPAGAVATFAVSASDMNDVIVTTSASSGSTFPLGTTEVQVTAIDAFGNETSGSFTITVQDTTAPTISAPADIVIEATGPGGSTVTFPASASDLVDGAVNVSASTASGSMFPVGTTSVTLTAADSRGNVASTTFNVTVSDTTAPVIFPHENLIVEAIAANGATVSFNLTAIDAVSGSLHVSAWPASGSTFPIGVTSVALSATDAAGNSVSSSFTVTVIDTTAPTISVPSDIFVEATGSTGASVGFSASATDLVSGQVSVSASPVSGSVFPLGTTDVQLSAVDAAGNASTASFNITVRDTTAPSLNLPASQTLEATSAAGAVATFSASASDAVDGSVTVTLAPESGSVFALGSTTVQASATDAAGNTRSGSFEVRVVDTTAPAIVQANIVTEASGPAGAVVSFSPFATDIVSGNVAVLSDIASGSVFPVGTTTVMLSATDAAGNTAIHSFSVTVADTTAPVIAPHDNLVVEATSAAGAVVEFTPSALDIVDGAVSVTASPASGSTFPLGETLVTLTAFDAAGNAITSSFTITVVDTTAPVIATPANIVAEATSAAGAVVTFEVSAFDLVDGAVGVSTSHVSGSVFPLGTTTVTLNAIDAAGNESSSSFTITVRDTTAPVIAALDNQTLEATGPGGATATFVATASDAVGATVSYSVAPGSTFALGTTTVTVTASDAAGNSSTASFAIVVRDTTAPALFPPAGQTLEATSAAGATASYTATALDVVSGNVPVAFSIQSGSTFPLGVTTVTASTIDAAGNSASALFSIVVVDTTAPVIATPANIVLEATAASGAIATFNASAFDIVSGSVPVSASKASGSRFALGVTTVTLAAADAAGNSSSSSFTVTVVDTTAPSITVPADIVIDSSTVMGATATYTVTAHDIVDGSLAVTLSKASGTIFPIGTTVVTAQVTDAAGNTATKTFNVTGRAPAAALVNQISAMNGTINGSIQQRTNYGVTLNGGGKITGELLTVGTPTTRLNGKPAFGGTVDSTGSANPSGYTITLNGNSTLGKLVRRYDAVAMPTVAAPSNPTGSRSVNLNKSSDSVGAWATLKNLTLNGNVGNVAVPAGVYGNFTANGGSGLTLGVAGASTPSVYHFQNLTLNGNSTFKVVGPVIVIVKNGINVNASMGSSANPAWLDLRVSNGGVTLNGNVNVDGYVTAPSGTVTINGNSELRGGLAADKLVLNGNSKLTLLHR